MKRSLIIFLKWPEPGQVKTRLAAEIGAASATRYYRRMTLTILGMAGLERGTEIVICFSPAERQSSFERWFRQENVLRPEMRFLPQVSGDLGRRQEAAASDAFERGSNMVLLIGTDCVTLSNALLRQAWSALGGGGIRSVLGPALDGGYYLLGLSEMSAGIFDDVPWSSPQTAMKCRKNLLGAGFSVETLMALRDIDNYEDLCSAYPNPEID